MTRQKQLEAIKEIAEEVGGTVRTNYSGRCMYGKQCFGVVARSAGDIIEAAASRGIKRASQDSMGLGAIVYWQHIAGASEEEAKQFDD